jgi:hypothetical protein
METITLEYDVRNERAKEMIEIILSSGLATRKRFGVEEALENAVNKRAMISKSRNIDVKPEKTEVHEALPFSTGLWADYDIDDRTLRAKAWGTYKRAI